MGIYESLINSDLRDTKLMHLVKVNIDKLKR